MVKMRSKSFLIFLVLYLSWTVSLVHSARRMSGDEELLLQGAHDRRHVGQSSSTTRRILVKSSSSDEDEEREDGGRKASKSRVLSGSIIGEGEVDRRGAVDMHRGASSLSAKKRAPLAERKQRLFRAAEDYDRFYTEAALAYKDGPSATPVQIVDQHGNFMTLPRGEGALGEERAEIERAQEDLTKMMAALKGIEGKDYLIVSVFGHQSTGKSYLMNEVFGTDFGIKGSGVRDQFTRGVWMAHSPALPKVLVVDCEGTGGSERLQQQGKEAVIAAYGMVYAMLVSQVAIFNLDYVQVGDAEQELMFTNTLEHYMRNKAPNAPALRVIISIRNVPSDAMLKNLERKSREIVTRAFEKNKKGGQLIGEFFDVKFFWFGHFNVKTPKLTADIAGYEAPEFFEEHGHLERVSPLFTHRLALFKRRFTHNDEDGGYYLGGLAPLMPVTQLSSFLHQFWDLINSKDVGLENPLELTFKKRLNEAVDQRLVTYERTFKELIEASADKAPELVQERLRRLVEGAQKEYPEALGDLVPAYANPLVEEATEKLLLALRKINKQYTPKLLQAMANDAALTLPQAAQLLLDQNTHAKEVEAVELFKARIAAIQKLCPECSRESWAGELRLAEQRIEQAALQQQDERVSGLILHELESVHGGDGDLVAGVAQLAQRIAGPEGLDPLALQTKVAKAYHTQIAHHNSRKQRVMAVLGRDYSFGEHVSRGDSHLDSVLHRAHAKKDQLLAFRNHFDGRVGFHQTEDSWRQDLEADIADFARDKKDRREMHVTQLEASYKESSLRYALGLIMCYQVVTDFSLMQVFFWTFIFLMAMSGMLGPQILDPARWAALPGYLATTVAYLITAGSALFHMASLGRRGFAQIVAQVMPVKQE